MILKQTCDQLIQSLMMGSFCPHKWVSNDFRLLSDIFETDHGLAVDKHLGDDLSIRILGIVWSPSSDSSKVHRQVIPNSSFTKCSFLSLLARIFDLLEWIVPVTIIAKIIMQSF